MIDVQIQRAGHGTIEIRVGENSTIETVLSQAGINLTTAEKCYVNRVAVLPGAIIDDGDLIQIIAGKDNGSN